MQSVTLLTGGYTVPSGWLKGVTSENIQNFFGSYLDENITGNALDNHIYGSGGNNFLTGGMGADTFYIISTDTITDLTTGDAIFVSEGGMATCTEVINFVATDATVNNGRLIISTALNENSHIDLSLASSGIYSLKGGSRSDTLVGSPGIDDIVGGDGDDIINGGTGDDTFTGSSGADTFQFSLSMGHDTIKDFNEIHGDKIDFLGLTNQDISKTVQENESRIIYTLADGSTLSLQNPILITDVDILAPVLDEISIRDNTLSVGDTLIFDYQVSDQTGIGSFYMSVVNEFGQGFFINEFVKDGMFELEITSDMAAGNYTVHFVSLTDTTNVGNYVTYNDNSFGFGGMTDPSLHHPIDFSALNFTISSQLEEIPSTQTLNGTITSWTGNPVEGALVKGVDSTGTEVGSMITNATGQFNFNVADDVSLTVTKDFTNDRTITVRDALDALRMSVGMTKVDGSLDPKDYITADYNKDGKVSVTDALEILKYSLDMDVTQAQWIFIKDDLDLSGLDRRNVNYSEDLSVSFSDLNNNQDITGILLGDVNGTI